MNRFGILRRTLAVATVSVLAYGAGPPARAEDQSPVLRLQATAVNLNDRAKVTPIDIVIERWATPEEVQSLQATFVEQGADKLLSSLQKVKPRCGYVRSATSLGWDIYYARELEGPDGATKIVLATDRPVSVWEARNSGRSMDYQFSLAEIRIKDGKGEGKAIPAAKLTLDKATKTLEIENWDREPVRLNDITVVSGGK